MRDDPRRTLKWMEQELLSSEAPDTYMDETAELLAMADLVLEEDPEPPVFVHRTKKKTKGEKIEEAHISRQFDESAAVLTKTKKQLRREAKLRKKETVNRNLKGLVFLAILEICGILAILGWWLQ